MTKHVTLEELKGSTALSTRRAPETKEADVSAEIKKGFEELNTAWEAFKKKNDERLTEVEKKREDILTKDELEKINKSIDEAVAKVEKELKRRADELEAKANRLALSGGGGEAETKAVADWAKLLGKKATPDELREYKTALDAQLRNPEAKAVTLQVGVDPAGGYFVTPDTSGRMVKKIYESSPMRQLANVVTIGTDALEGPIDNGEAEAQWVGEKQTRVQTDAPQVGMWRIAVHELYAYPKVTQKLLDDASVDIESWLSGKAADRFARKEATAFVSGDGQLKPEGLLMRAPVSTGDASRTWNLFQYLPTGASGAFASSNPADAIIDLIYALKAGYRANAKFFMARSTVGAVRKLKDGQGNYLWAPGATAGQPSTLFAYPVVEGEDMPAIAANSLGIGFGDFAEAYTIVDRLTSSVIRDNITQIGFVKFNFRKRVGGGVVNGEAVKFLKFATS
jgi:HK97 family phage major capsid protein